MTQIVLPYDFVGGTRAIADQVDANFNALANAFATNVNTHLTAATTFYVSPTGADIAGNGLSATSPAATMRYIIGLIRSQYNVNAQYVTIQLANGTYTEELDNAGAITGLTGAAAMVIQGNMANPGLVVWNGGANACLNCANGALMTVQGMQMQNANANCIISQVGSRVFLNNIVFGAAGGGGSHLVAARGGIIQVNGNYTISGSAAHHALALESGEIYLDQEPTNYITFVSGLPTITITGAPAFSISFVQANALGLVKVLAAFSGTIAAGNQGGASLNGAINIGGQGTSYLPGTPNTVNILTGGQYA